MRLLGAVVLAAGLLAASEATRRALASRRPADVAYAVLAPLALLVALLGGVLVFVPGFLG